MSAIKALLRDIYASSLYLLGASRPARLGRGQLLILTFHRVLPAALRQAYALPGLVVTPEELGWILAQLKSHFQVDTVTGAQQSLQAGTAERPLLAISFDDGQWDNLAYAAPVLAELQLPATFYLPTDFVGGEALLWHDQAAHLWTHPRLQMQKKTALAQALDRQAASEIFTDTGAFMAWSKRLSPADRSALIGELQVSTGADWPDWMRLMTWAEVRQLQAAGHEIGSHACSHGLLPQMDAATQQQELLQSRQTIAAQLGTEAVSLCYPNGSYDQVTLGLAEVCGYQNAVTTHWGINRADTPIYELVRCDMDSRYLTDRHGRLSRARLGMRISGLQPGLAASAYS